MPAAGPSLEALRATVERLEARASAQNDPSLAEPRRLYAELAERFQADLRAPRDVALAKSAALMVLQALAQARSRASVLVNIDVSDLPTATKFYCEALALEVGRRLGEGALELVGAGAAIYLLAKANGTRASPAMSEERHYQRHWTPVHLDFVVPDVHAAVARARAAGAVLEADVASYAWGHIALMADPFGHGFCLIQFVARGYDEITAA